MELRRYLSILRRQKWLLIQATLVVAVVAGVLSNLRTPVYSASSRVLLRPNDASEQLYPDANNAQGSLFSDPDRYVAAQENIAQSEAVAKEAAKDIKDATSDELLGEVSVSQEGSSDILDISGTSVDPVRARDVANAFARAYIENRRQFAVANLQKAADELQAKTDALQARLADLDKQIGDGGLQPGATSASVAPTNPTPAARQPVTGAAAQVTNPAPNPGGQPTTTEGLKAERYATALQYENLYARQQELLVDISLKRGEAEVVSLARTPGRPVSPKPKRDGVLGGFVGLLLGLGFAFLREQLDDRIRSREDAEAANGLTVLAELPYDEESAAHPGVLAADARPLGQLAEATRSLRTSLEFLGVDGAIRTLIVTSPGPQDGKSLVAANLGAVYAQAGFRTVLVSADLRRPRIESIFGLSKDGPGLTEVIAQMNELEPAPSRPPIAMGPDADAQALLERRERVEAAFRETGVPNLFLLPAGATPPNASELLASRRAAEVMEDLASLADVVIVDTPPVLAVTDAAVLAPKADGVILVNSLNQTHKGAATRAKETLESSHVRLLGVVLNRMTSEASTYQTYYAAYYGEVNGNGNGAAPAKGGRGLRRRAKVKA